MERSIKEINEILVTISDLFYGMKEFTNNFNIEKDYFLAMNIYLIK